jgi:sugar phosphate isomerase/epimerase
MNSSRRSFIRNSAMAAAGISLLQQNIFAAVKKGELTGIQLYSVRTDMKADPLGTLKQLSDMGYRHVEHANYANRKFYGWSVSEFRKILNGFGMSMPSGHTVLDAKHWDASKKDFTNEWKYTVEDAAAMGQSFVISPWLEESKRKSMGDLKSFMEVFNRSGEFCKKFGMKFGYHNHDFEFSEKVEGKVLFDIILAETDPNLVMQQLDIGNMLNGGGKALEVMQQYPGRFESMHVKDEIKATEGHEPFESTILGKGVVPVKTIIDLGRASGTKHFIIEQESYQGKTPMECADDDLEIMKKWGYK